MLSGQDILGQAQTGTGKTAAFSLPILHNLKPGQGHVQALVLAPTRELGLQVAEAMAEYGRYRQISVVAVYGGTPYGPQIGALRRGADIVVGTPGRLLDLIQSKKLDLSQVQTVVLDEADEMLSMGFIDDIEAILQQTPAERQTALFSATLPNQIRQLADKYMRAPQAITIERAQRTVSTIEQRAYLVNEQDKLAALTRLFEVERSPAP
jgi:ATP-dependent RNA helicase DeaD